MPKVNCFSLNHMLKMLDISSTTIMGALFVSQSLVSRWKTGGRTINSNSPIYKDLIDLMIRTDKEQGLGKLESFLWQQYPGKEGADLPFLLHKFLLGDGGNLPVIREPSFKEDETTFRIYNGLEERKKVLRDFFNKALALKEPKDLYIFDAENYKWEEGSWSDEYQKHCLRCMDAGINIYIFSSLYGMKKENFYMGWRFTSHYNLHPGYYSEYHDNRAFYSHYLIKDYMSVFFYSPEGNPKEFYTAVYTDPATCKVHYEYLKNKYDNASPQRILSSISNRIFMLNEVEMHSADSNPLVGIGVLPSFVFSLKTDVREILEQNNLSRDRKQLCNNFHSLFSQAVSNKINNEVSLLYYLEDLEEAVKGSDCLDLELSSISGCQVRITRAQLQKRFQDTAEVLRKNKRVSIYIIPKSFEPVYGVLGEMLTLWCKRNKWCMVTYENCPEEPRLILDSSACGLRGEMFNELFKMITQDIGSREKSIEILYRLGEMR